MKSQYSTTGERKPYTQSLESKNAEIQKNEDIDNISQEEQRENQHSDNTEATQLKRCKKVGDLSGKAEEGSSFYATSIISPGKENEYTEASQQFSAIKQGGNSRS